MMNSLMETCDKCFRETPVEYMIMLDDVHYLAFKSVVSDGVALIAELNSRTDDAVNLCTFCLTTCQQCEMLFLTTEGLIACELNADGFLTGVEIVLCPVCKSIEDLDAKIEHDGNTKWRSCLSNTTNSFKNDAFSTFDSKSEAQE